MAAVGRKFPKLFREKVGRDNHYCLGRLLEPFPTLEAIAPTPFVAPPRTPCIDPDYDQARESRLRRVHETRHGFQALGIADQSRPRSLGTHHESYTLRRLWANSPPQQPGLVIAPRCTAFTALRDEYRSYHHPFRGGTSA